MVGAVDGRLRVEQARARLGGSARGSVGAGRIVEVGDASGAKRLGVVLHQGERDVDVWLGESIVRRMATERAVTVDSVDGVPDELLRAAADARVFGAIERGARVLYDAGDGVVVEGLLLERCRYGALVARDDGAMLAVGFRRLWPVAGRS